MEFLNTYRKIKDKLYRYLLNDSSISSGNKLLTFLTKVVSFLVFFFSHKYLTTFNIFRVSFDLFFYFSERQRYQVLSWESVRNKKYILSEIADKVKKNILLFLIIWEKYSLLRNIKVIFFLLMISKKFIMIVIKK